MMKKILTIFLITMLVATLFTTGCANQEAEEPDNADVEDVEEVEEVVEPLKVALVLNGPINDGGWNAVAYEGLKQAEEALGIEGSFLENVSKSDYEEIYRNFALQDFDVIIGHGFEYNDVALNVAKDFPDIKFVVTSSNISQEPNVAGLEVANAEAGFIGGVLAGIFTESGKVAYIGGVAIPPITDAAKGFIAGAKLIDSNIEAESSMIGSWDDAVKAKEVATNYIEQGADVVLGNANIAGLGVLEAAKETGKYAVGFVSDQSEIAPDNIVASSKYDLAVAIKYVIQLIIEDKFEAKNYKLGTKEGATGIIWNEELKKTLDPAAIEKAEGIQQDLIDGKIDVASLIE